MIGDAIEPAAQRFINPERTGAPDQDHERRLKRVFDSMGVAQDITAHCTNHRAMTRHQGPKRLLVAAGDKPAQKRGVRLTNDRVTGEQQMN